MERARSEGLRQLASGASASSFVVSPLQLCYRRPARLADSLRIRLCLEELSGARSSLWQGILRGDELLCDGRVELASVDRQLRVCRLPEAWRDAISAWQGASATG